MPWRREEQIDRCARWPSFQTRCELYLSMPSRLRQWWLYNNASKSRTKMLSCGSLSSFIRSSSLLALHDSRCAVCIDISGSQMGLAGSLADESCSIFSILRKKYFRHFIFPFSSLFCLAFARRPTSNQRSHIYLHVGIPIFKHERAARATQPRTATSSRATVRQI